MTHHGMAEWIDYLRGLGDDRHRAAMEAHLRDGCEACRSVVSALKSLSEALRADEAFEPPPHAVARARAVFTRFRPERVGRLPRVLVRLVQDSLGDPLPAGVRGNERASQQALYEAGDMYVDLRVEQRPGQSSVTLVGQLMRHDDGRSSTARRPVVITCGRAVLASAASNDHGEFYFDCVPARDMRLHIPVDDGSGQIEIALGPLMPPAGRHRH